jgi:hypothetical protein
MALEALALLGAMGIFAFIIGIGIYIYFALTLMTVAKKTGTKHPWLAWIPIANIFLLVNIAEGQWWPILIAILAPILMLIPVVGMVLFVIVHILFVIYMFAVLWKICGKRNRPGWWVLLLLIPIFGTIWAFIMWGLLAWSEA